MMNRYTNAFFDEPIDRRGTDCFKWDHLCALEGRELLPAWVADMDFRCADEITEAIVRRAQHPVYGYTEPTCESVEAMLSFLRRRHGVNLTAEQQLLLPGVVPGLRAAINTLTQPSDSVLIQPPVYGPFFDSVEQNGRKVVENPLIADANGHYSMDLDGVEAAFRDGVRIAILCNPHNPVARAWSREELSAMYTLCERYGVLLVADEIHQDYVFVRGGFISVLTLDESEEANILVLTSAGKTFNLAGLQQGVLLTRNPKLLHSLAANMHNVGIAAGNIFALTATEAAYRYGDAWLDALLSYLAEARALLRQELAMRLPEAIMSPQEATYLAWLDLRAYGMTTAELMRRTHAQGVALSPGTFFSKTAGEGYLRFNFGCPHSQTLEAVRRLEIAIKHN